MPSLKDIRKRISGTKNTQQITKAMKMVAAAKLRRSQNAIVSARPYAYKIHSVISHLTEGGAFKHPLMENKEVPQKLLFVVLTSDRGLCGAFNTNIIKNADRFFKENKNKYEIINFIFVGRRGAEYFKKRGVDPVEVITNLAADVNYDMAASLAKQIMDEFIGGGYDEVRMIYNEFKSAISQKVVAEKVLPIQKAAEQTVDQVLDYTFEPGAEVILDQLLPKHFAIQIYRAMLESLASEHGARMTAMDNATRNASQMIRKLTLTYNKLRQAAITKELMEIVSGAEALK